MTDPAEPVSPDTVAAVVPLALSAVETGDHRLDAVPLSSTRMSEQLDRILTDLAALAGFGVAALSMARSDGSLQAVKVVGAGLSARETARMVVPAEVWPRVMLDGVEQHGWFHHRISSEIDELGASWVPPIPAATDEVQWDPYDMVNFAVRRPDGEIVGVFALDLPLSGRVPSGEEWQRMGAAGRIAGQAVLALMEVERQSVRAQLAETARTVLRRAAGELPPAQAVAQARPSIEQGLGADLVHYQLFDDWRVEGDLTMVSLCELQLIDAWHNGVGVIRIDLDDPQSLAAIASTEAQLDAITGRLRQIRMPQMLLVAIGSGSECYGGLALGRVDAAAAWTEDEGLAAADIAQDLGRSIANFEAQAREHQLLVDLQRVADYKSRLVATVSHDLVSPLSAIRLHLDLLSQTDADSDLVPYAVQAMQRATQELLLSVEGLLALYRADFARSPQEKVDLRTVVAQVVDAHQMLAEAGGITLVNDTDSDTAIMINGDRVELGRVVANLVGNAVKYTPSGEVRVRVTSRDAMAVLECTDTGVGISETDQEQIFDEFFRSSNPLVRERPGNGLGMAIVSRIVESYRGTIELSSVLGEGTRIVVLLPLA